MVFKEKPVFPPHGFSSSSKWLRVGLRILSSLWKKERQGGPLQPQLRVGTSALWLHPWVWARPPQFQSLRTRAVPLVGKTLKITSPWERMGGKHALSICHKALDYLARRSFRLWFISAVFESYFKMGLFTHLFYLHLWLLHSRELRLIYCLGLGLLSALDISQNRSFLKARQDRKEIQKNFRSSLTSGDYLSRQPGWHDPLWTEDDENSPRVLMAAS